MMYQEITEEFKEFAKRVKDLENSVLSINATLCAYYELNNGQYVNSQKLLIGFDRGDDDGRVSLAITLSPDTSIDHILDLVTRVVDFSPIRDREVFLAKVEESIRYAGLDACIDANV